MSLDRRDADAPEDVLQGTLDLLVLRALQLEPMHGWGIAERIEQWSESILQLGQGTLYPALYRLERRGLIASKWRTTENQRRARYYALTAAGRRQLAREIASWERLSRAIALVIEATKA
jgi:transcriptional regulator